MEEPIKVGIADLKVATNPATMVTIGLGSCVAVALLDVTAKVGALIHIMLPDSEEVKNRENKAKFANTAIPLAVKNMVRFGATKSRIIAKIAGGAHMFSFAGDDKMSVGDRNVEAVKIALKNEGIKLRAEETGGKVGRSVKFNIKTGKVYVKTMARGMIQI